MGVNKMPTEDRESFGTGWNDVPGLVSGGAAKKGESDDDARNEDGQPQESWSEVAPKGESHA